MRESDPISTFGIHQQALGSVFGFEQAKRGVVKRSLVEARDDELGVTMEAPRCDFLVGNDADENAGIGEQELSAWSEDSSNLTKERAPIADMEDDVQRHRGVERAALERERAIQIRFLDRRQAIQTECGGAATTDDNGFGTHVQPGAAAADRAEDISQWSTGTTADIEETMRR
jgi:hypothetical protein